MRGINCTTLWIKAQYKMQSIYHLPYAHYYLHVKWSASIHCPQKDHRLHSRLPHSSQSMDRTLIKLTSRYKKINSRIECRPWVPDLIRKGLSVGAGLSHLIELMNGLQEPRWPMLRTEGWGLESPPLPRLSLAGSRWSDIIGSSLRGRKGGLSNLDSHIRSASDTWSYGRQARGCITLWISRS